VLVAIIKILDGLASKTNSGLAARGANRFSMPGCLLFESADVSNRAEFSGGIATSYGASSS
jgi:hypothetical protein